MFKFIVRQAETSLRSVSSCPCLLYRRYAAPLACCARWAVSTSCPCVHSCKPRSVTDVTELFCNIRCYAEWKKRSYQGHCQPKPREGHCALIGGLMPEARKLRQGVWQGKVLPRTGASNPLSARKQLPPSRPKPANIGFEFNCPYAQTNDNFFDQLLTSICVYVCGNYKQSIL